MFLLGEYDQLRFDAAASYVADLPFAASFSERFNWNIKAFYAHAFGSFRLGVGAIFPDTITGALPVFPIIGFWWRW